MPYMQEGIEPKNPLDLGIPGGLKQAAGVCDVVAKDPNVDMIAWAAMLPSKAGAWDGVELLQAMVRGTDKPIVGFGRMSYQMTPEAVEAQTLAGFPFLQGLEPTIRALNGLWFHAQRTGKKPPRRPPPRRAIFRRRRSMRRSRNTASRCRKAARSRPPRKPPPPPRRSAFRWC